MRDDSFLSAGVPPGGLHSREEIRLLLCFLAGRLAQPLTEPLAEQVFAGEGLANYFEYTAALHALLKAGQLTMSVEAGEAVLRLDAKIAHAADELAKELPRRVRDRALHAAERLQAQSRREQENGVTVYPAGGGGCYMTFRQGRGGDMLMSVTLYAPDRETAEAMRAKFLEHPGKLYSAVLESFR
ncbi:MAG: DUF4364 family protein [Oscillospiraceae bacterium]|jgi:hypothetical protein|nr:DUF4364 family protein [Oscillospiraceae bacterium]